MMGTSAKFDDLYRAGPGGAPPPEYKITLVKLNLTLTDLTVREPGDCFYITDCFGVAAASAPQTQLQEVPAITTEYPTSTGMMFNLGEALLGCSVRIPRPKSSSGHNNVDLAASCEIKLTGCLTKLFPVVRRVRPHDRQIRSTGSLEQSLRFS